MPPTALQPGEAETKRAPAGSVSVIVMLVAIPGPLLINTRLYVRGDPTSTGLGEAVILTKARSACWLKVAITVVAAVMAAVQGPVPVQPPPLQPTKLEPVAG